jgi:hypothetical protein
VCVQFYKFDKFDQDSHSFYSSHVAYVRTQMTFCILISCFALHKLAAVVCVRGKNEREKIYSSYTR